MVSFKRNYVVYFYVYFVAQVVFIYINVYLPVYFFNILKINRTELAFIQTFSYSALFLKPVVAVYYDKEKVIRKTLIIISSFGVFFSFIIFIISIDFLIIFGIFLGINFACISVMDVAIDKIIVNYSPDEKSKDRNALLTQLGSMAGAIIPNVISYLIFRDIYSKSTWNLFFLIGILSILPLVFISFLLNVKIDTPKETENINENPIRLKAIILMCIFLFFAFADKLYEYPLEPWLLNKYGEENFSLFLLYLILIILINVISVITAGIISNKYDRRKIIIISSISSGIILLIIPFTDLITFFILFGVLQIFAGFILINLIALMIDLSKKRVLIYQVMSSFVILASVVFIPLGTYLSAYIATEMIIVSAGLLIIISAVPIYFMKDT